MTQMLGREISYQQVGRSNPEHSNSFFFEFSLHNVDNLIEAVAALLVASVYTSIACVIV